jgi:hypothetical protein
MRTGNGSDVTLSAPETSLRKRDLSGHVSYIGEICHILQNRGIRKVHGVSFSIINIINSDITVFIHYISINVKIKYINEEIEIVQHLS